MPVHRCRAPGCGRFVSAGVSMCARHAGETTATLDVEIQAIRALLDDVQAFPDLEFRARLIPRIVSVSIQAVKSGHELENQANNDLLVMLASIAPELEKNRHAGPSLE